MQLTTGRFLQGDSCNVYPNSENLKQASAHLQRHGAGKVALHLRAGALRQVRQLLVHLQACTKAIRMVAGSISGASTSAADLQMGP